MFSPATDPELSVWNMAAVDGGPSHATVTAGPNTTTNDPCSIQFRLFSGRIGYAFPWSTPEQNNPHAAEVTISDYAHRGLDYDISWRWWISPDDPSPFSDVIGTIFIPLVGGDPTVGNPI